jgi:hypothetical protein
VSRFAKRRCLRQTNTPPYPNQHRTSRAEWSGEDRDSRGEGKHEEADDYVDPMAPTGAVGGQTESIFNLVKVKRPQTSIVTHDDDPGEKPADYKPTDAPDVWINDDDSVAANSVNMSVNSMGGQSADGIPASPLNVEQIQGGDGMKYTPADAHMPWRTGGDTGDEVGDGTLFDGRRGSSDRGGSKTDPGGRVGDGRVAECTEEPWLKGVQATSHDLAHIGAHALTSDLSQFWYTTGMYPQVSAIESPVAVLEARVLFLAAEA